jgi:hypothetical protein
VLDGQAYVGEHRGQESDYDVGVQRRHEESGPRQRKESGTGHYIKGPRELKAKLASSWGIKATAA